MLYKKGNWQQFKRDGTITVKRTLNMWFKFFCALKLVLVGFQCRVIFSGRTATLLTS